MDWKPFNEVDFSDESISQYHVDTRDFCINTMGFETEIPAIDLFKTRKCPDNYFFTPEEIRSLIERYFNESGGKGEWRMFALDGEGASITSGWQLKYIRIFRLKHRMYKGKMGLVVYNNQYKHLFSKTTLASPVAQQYLNLIK